MSDKNRPENDHPESLAEIASLDSYLDRLSRPEASDPEETRSGDAVTRAMAAQMRLLREGVEEPDPTFLQRLEARIGSVQPEQSRDATKRPRPSRMGFLRAAAGVAAAAGLLGAGFEADELQHRLRQPQKLVQGNGRWYDIGALGDVASGQMKAFAAGGILGFLINDGGRLHAVSAICTHMGCRLKPEAGAFDLRCLCHGSRFNSDGQVLAGLARDPLPHIPLRIDGGRVYAQGTEEDV